MTSWFVTLTPDLPLLDAIDQLAARHATGAPVVGPRNELVGILTEKDCLRVLAGNAYGEVAGGTVGGFMSPVKAVIHGDMDLLSIADAFLQSNFPVLPVLDGERLVGRISRQDVLQQVQRFLGQQHNERARSEEAQQASRQRPRSIDRLQRLASSHTPEQLASILKRRQP